MSKAFTKETDGGDDEELGLPALPLGARNYMTPAGYARLRAELFTLIDDERPQVVEIVHWAASNGDRSENGDYLYGKKRLREIDRRIRFLTKRLEIAEVVDPAVHHGSDQVFFGATVTYADNMALIGSAFAPTNFRAIQQSIDADRFSTELLLGQIEHLSGQADDWVWSSAQLNELIGSKPVEQIDISLEATMQEFNQMVHQAQHTEEIIIQEPTTPAWSFIIAPVVALTILLFLYCTYLQLIAV